MNHYAVTYIVRGSGVIADLRVACPSRADIRQTIATAIMQPTLMVDILDIKQLP